MLFADFADKFMEVSAAVGNSPGELNQKRMALDNHLLPYFGQVDMETLHIPEVRAYTAFKREQGYAQNTVNGHLGIFSRYLALAREERVLLAPKFTVHISRKDCTEARWLSDAERDTLLRAAAIEGGEIEAMVRFVLSTGLRIGEVQALLHSDIDPKQKHVTVRASYDRVSRAVKSTKNGEIRSVPLTSAARHALASIPAHGQSTVFTLTYHQAYSGLERIASAAKLDRVGWHTLRHTFATMLIGNGAPLLITSRLLGHKSIAMTEKYLHLSPEHAGSALDLMPSF